MAVLATLMSEKTVSHPHVDFSHLIIRKVKNEDLSFLEWDGEFLKFRRMYASIYRDSLLGKTLMWLVELLPGEIIGQAFVMLWGGGKGLADGKEHAYMFSFRVKPQWRNFGIGSYLMNFIENDLIERRYKYLTLNVARENPDALRLYERLGYRILHATPGDWSYVDHEGNLQYVHEPAWRMIKALSQPSVKSQK
mgnify:CR=1 FL=1